jgi:hypothetical protein
MTTQVDQEAGSEKQTVSNRKIRANRQNALKSTGSRTQRGKAYSRRNAIKHGLFVMSPFIYDSTNRENHAHYQEILDGLAESYKPVGAAEQLEVERIAACWWKLGRAWRYENAEIAAGHVNSALRVHQRMSRTPLSSEDQARLVLLRSAEAEIESTDTISDELREKMFAADPEFRKQWESLEKATKEKFSEILAQLRIQFSTADELAQDPASVLLLTTLIAIYMLEHRTEHLAKSALQTANDRVAIPPAEALDRVLRADAAAERGLSRAIDRLERLQRRRTGEPVPPLVSVRLTR